MINPKFHTKTGQLTVYSFLCGYIEQTDIEGKRTTLWLDCGVWHVRAHNFIEHKRIAWETFNTLREARKFYRLAIKG